ncbi:MAG: hypothetical protein KC731_08640 [Myxococcales bacterium]|nr:hypothetical protein [Myxococcales bacterium]
MRVFTAILALALLACSSTPRAGGETAEPSPSSSLGAAPTVSAGAIASPAPTAIDAAVGPTTTFQELLAALGRSKASAGCLFDGSQLGTRRVDVVGATTRLVDFAKVEGSPSFSIGLSTPHGTTRQVTREAFDSGGRDETVDHWLATVTPLSPGAMQQPALVVLWVTAEATWFSAIVPSGVVGESWTKLAGGDLAQFQGLVRKLRSVVVTADPDVRLERLRDALKETSIERLEVALAATTDAPAPRHRDGVVDHVDALPKGTPGVCRTGIGDIPPGLTPGSGFELMKHVEDFDAAVAKACLAAVPAGAVGAQMQVAMRVMKGGEVSEACISKDPVGDEGLRQCVVAEAKRYRFPALADGDFQNIGMAVTIAPPGGLVTGICGD